MPAPPLRREGSPIGEDSGAVTSNLGSYVPEMLPEGLAGQAINKGLKGLFQVAKSTAKAAFNRVSTLRGGDVHGWLTRV